ncbi:hypothetical protein A3SI_15850 [Nitritalea halalkaliphila LW7]|uniref:Uncharacterized protein n=1 Tax=Nitritalea halalkaliphila LW7 TaxID=1189621 RepID=I5BY34_9BACT|nr:hypothetical protein [Nitritalea halalkaliphila]EIM74486.1 hypothetical protein A3SI_15850 [Nitritalea halalkaliphila LW7]
MQKFFLYAAAGLVSGVGAYSFLSAFYEVYQEGQLPDLSFSGDQIPVYFYSVGAYKGMTLAFSIYFIGVLLAYVRAVWKKKGQLVFYSLLAGLTGFLLFLILSAIKVGIPENISLS